jgi:SMODS and SLOG-associating 2TM effector domain 1
MEVAPPSPDGRIPITFRIGVTGHRTLADPGALRAPIREAIGRLRELLPAREFVLIVISALAEGADRLVAQEVMAVEGARLEVALPRPEGDYANDFQTEESKKEFRDLLDRASYVWQVPAEQDHEDGYEQAGRYVVDRSDAVIALWDGKPSRGRGGTAEIVAYAKKQEVPWAWVHTEGEPTVTWTLDTPRAAALQAAVRKLEDYNNKGIKPATFARSMGDLHKELMPDITAETRGDPLGLSRGTVADWLFPYLVRADALAMRSQHWFRRASWLIFALAAAAVAVVAFQSNFAPGLNWLAIFEVAFLLVLLSILWMSRRRRLHDQWISCRFLAERLRSSYFLALAGTGDRRARPVRLAYFQDPSEAWIERALTEVMTLRPKLDHQPSQVESLRGYLSRCWIGGQITYHHKTSRKQGTFEDRLAIITVSLFLLTLVAAFIHIFSKHLHSEFWEELIIVVSITVPAIGAAFHGFGTQRQFRRHAERYHRMEGLLKQVQREMDGATSLDQVREVAAQTEQLMREENSDWFGVMRFHDMELIT